MSVIFNATTTRVVTAAAVQIWAPKWSAVFWSYATGLGEANGGRVLAIGRIDGTGVLILHNTVANEINFQQVWSGGTGSWKVTAPDNQWNAMACSYDGSSDANDPTIMVNFKVVSSTETSSPSGTITAPANTGYCIGNRSAADRTWAGSLAHVQYFKGVVLTPGEMNQALWHPGKITRGLRLWCPLNSPSDITTKSRQQSVPQVIAPAQGRHPPLCRPYTHRFSRSFG